MVCNPLCSRSQRSLSLVCAGEQGSGVGGGGVEQSTAVEFGDGGVGGELEVDGGVGGDAMPPSSSVESVSESVEVDRGIHGGASVVQEVHGGVQASH
ncbi:hypothetical protein Dimus_001137 [Dionaea muscipula]